MAESIFFPAEWFPQSGIQLTWPHEDSDWKPLLPEVVPCFVSIAKEIAKREKLIIVCRDENETRTRLGGSACCSNIIFKEIASNDTWARDHGGISVFMNGKPVIYDFTFNGWGMKFPANHDNLITARLFADDTFNEGVKRISMQPFVLEGGGIESDGKGTLMATVRCMASCNRNDHLAFEQLEYRLKEMFGAERILWIHNGFLKGDDTDSHVDTLARFCDENTIAYVQCGDREDEHYSCLKEMEKELQEFRTSGGEPYKLVPLPMADAVEWEGERLPATYANFLIMNGAVLLPFYNSPKDEIARAMLQKAFPDREITGVNCLPLIKQHGSLHCVTMQYPEGFIK